MCGGGHFFNTNTLEVEEKTSPPIIFGPKWSIKKQSVTHIGTNLLKVKC